MLLPWLLLLPLPTTIGVLLCLLLVTTHIFFFCGTLPHFLTMAPQVQGFETTAILLGEDVSLTPNPQPEGSGIFLCPACVILPAFMLLLS
jgi:hypothetical protein